MKSIFKVIQIPDARFIDIRNSIIPFGKLGNSGSKIGISKNNSKQVIKLFIDKLNINTAFIFQDCLKISNRFNEVFINYIITYLDKIINISSDEYTKVKQYTLPILDYGISQYGSYITIPLIGIYDDSSKNNSKWITNLRELLDINHKSNLERAVFENRNDILKEYDKFMANKINNYLEVLKYLKSNIDPYQCINHNLDYGISAQQSPFYKL